MGTIKTLVNDASVDDFINSIEDGTKRLDSVKLLELYREITNEIPKMWGSSIVGFGQYHYKSERSSQEGDWPLIAFSPRKQSLSLYFMDGFEGHADLLKILGKHKTGKGCLYINKLTDVDIDVLRQMIARSMERAKQMHGA